MTDLYFEAKKNEGLTFYIGLHASADDDTMQANPTLEAGDFTISGSGAAFANLATLPAVDPAAGRGVKVIVSAAEMNFDHVYINCEDQTAPEEWKAFYITIHTRAVDIDDLVRSTTPANALDVSATGEAGLDFDNIKDASGAHTLTNITVPVVAALTGHTVQTGDSFARLAAPSGASVSADIAALKAETALIVADTAELQVDWANGGRLDLLIDAILADTAELQTDWTNGGRLDLLIDSILADTGELQTDWANGGRLDLLIDSILADTGELQTDWANGGRLDLILDAILANTDAVLADTGTSGVLINLAQAYSEGQTARTVGGALEALEAEARNRIVNTGVDGTRTVYRSDGTTTLIVRNVVSDTEIASI